MIIRKKVDIQSFVNSFYKYANNDGTKYYFVIDELINLIWKNRGEVNRVLKTATQNATEMVANV